MNPVLRRFCLPILLCACLPAAAMEIDWVRMTGRWPVESAPIVTDLDGDQQNEILAVNRGGELLLWRLDGTPVGSGPDGRAGQLPEGQWTSSPTRVDTPNGPLIVCCSVEGLVVALGPDLQERWRYQLPGETVWAKAVPAVVPDKAGTLLCFMDQSGTLTTLKVDGTLAWSVKSEEGPGGPSATTFPTPRDVPWSLGTPFILAPLGTKLVCLIPDGRTVWSTVITSAHGDPVVVRSQHEMVGVPGGGAVVVTADGGTVAVVDLYNGAVVRRMELPAELDNPPTRYVRPDNSSCLVLTGLWGNLYALEPFSGPVWTHEFRSKNRGKPLLFDVNGDTVEDIVQATYAQHVLAFNGDGRLIDDLRVNGLANPSLMPCHDNSGNPGFLVSTAALLMYRIKPGPATSPYGAENVTPEGVTLNLDGQRLLVKNPRGALISVHLRSEGGPEGKVLYGALTSRSHFELPLPAPGHYHAEVSTPDGRVFAEAEGDASAVPAEEPAPLGLFTSADAVTVDPLYIGEAGDATFRLGANVEKPVRVRVTFDTPKREDGAAFTGTVSLREAVSVRAVNGEEVEDALNPLDPAGLTLLQSSKPSTLWIAVDARSAESGHYTGQITVTPVESISDAAKPLEIPLNIEVLPLAMPERFPLRLCTWDYVPNRWFPEHTEHVLDDMQRHGVDIFPRSIVPEATADASGTLQMDWAKLDAELDRLKGRGQILFHIGHPAITFTEAPSDEVKRAAELEYLRAFRDHLEQRDLDYGDYAFYPVDEPGLEYQVANVDVQVDTATLFAKADPRFRVYTDPVPSLSWESFQRIAPLIDVWCPNMRQVSGLLAQDPRIKQIMDADVPVWSYECVGQVKSLSPLRYNRANAWRAWYFGLDGIGFWTHSQTQKDMWFPSDDEYALVYPGKLPVPSVRWEAVRDGMEDVAAMALLEAEIARHRGAGTKTDIVAKAEDTLRIAKIDIMELSDPAFVESRDYLREGDRRIWHSPADVETYRRHRAAIADLTLALQGKQEQEPRVTRTGAASYP